MLNNREIQKTKKVAIPEGDYCCTKVGAKSGRTLRRQCPLQDYSSCSLYEEDLEWDVTEKAFKRLSECKAEDGEK